MPRVTSAQLQKSFGRWREEALREPVVITNHGRESLVLLSAEEYRRLKRRDREALHVWELDDRDVEAIAGAQAPEESALFDDEVSGRRTR
jgi:PHD/YefM family antitoxin component YafN of YafNO toxin-antitoxin module